MKKILCFFTCGLFLHGASACVSQPQVAPGQPRIEPAVKSEKKGTSVHTGLTGASKGKKKIKEEPEDEREKEKEKEKENELEVQNVSKRKVVESITNQLKIGKGVSSSLTGTTPQGEICFVKVDTSPEFDGQAKLQFTVSEMHNGIEDSTPFKVSTRLPDKACLSIVHTTVSSTQSKISVDQTESGCELGTLQKQLTVELLANSEKNFSIVLSIDGANIMTRDCKVSFDKVTF